MHACMRLYVKGMSTKLTAAHACIGGRGHVTKHTGQCI